MSFLRRLWDAPRFCRDCGKRVSVDNQPEFDPNTGASKDRWFWHCPDVYVELIAGGGSYVTQRGDYVHRWGMGRPWWHRMETA